jgi:hypothetical protein
LFGLDPSEGADARGRSGEQRLRPLGEGDRRRDAERLLDGAR